ncbi:N-acetylmuramoyl-L-alanine amidase AmiD-like [Metopolophium dirhodum]|uniref:N-acetylmuramoyl-L-alanine amidase AmiD-like n=1 Tax=Metopolophium dirhodum TaxID=44670 RepID=UPI00298F8633|nr:N-acetylmuramoyl-L-alanine amidase AmiD-like [Metopolophium dirhodum]
MVHKEYFNPVHGYAISPFKSPNANRNHFYHRNVNNKIKIIVLHFTDLDFRTTVKEFTSKRSNTFRNVSSQYVIERPTEAGTHNLLMQVVPENCVSRHAGISLWGNYSSINSISIGIEIVNYGYNATNNS